MLDLRGRRVNKITVLIDDELATQIGFDHEQTFGAGVGVKDSALNSGHHSVAVTEVEVVIKNVAVHTAASFGPLGVHTHIVDRIRLGRHGNRDGGGLVGAVYVGGRIGKAVRTKKIRIWRIGEGSVRVDTDRTIPRLTKARNRNRPGIAVIIENVAIEIIVLSNHKSIRRDVRNRIDRDGHRRRIGLAIRIGYLIGKAVGAIEVRIGRIGKGAIGIEHQSPVCGSTDQGSGQCAASRIGIIQRNSATKRRVFVGRKGIINRIRRHGRLFGGKSFRVRLGNRNPRIIAAQKYVGTEPRGNIAAVEGLKFGAAAGSAPSRGGNSAGIKTRYGRNNIGGRNHDPVGQRQGRRQARRSHNEKALQHNLRAVGQSDDQISRLVGILAKIGFGERSNGDRNYIAGINDNNDRSAGRRGCRLRIRILRIFRGFRSLLFLFGFLCHLEASTFDGLDR